MIARAVSSLFQRRFRNRTAAPEVRQGEHAECGLAALAMAMGHHGVHVPLHVLRAEAGSTLLGSTVLVLRDLARRHGLAASAHRVEPDAMEALGFPLVAHSRFIHFVVVERVSGEGVHINDPSSGPDILPHHVFSRDFTGIAIRLGPGDAAPEGRPFSAFRDYLARTRFQRGQMLLAAGLEGLSALGFSAGVVALAQGIGARLASGTPWPSVPAGLVLLMLSMIADVLALHLTVSSVAKVVRRESSAVLAASRRWPTSLFLMRGIGQVLGRLGAPAALGDAAPPIAALAAVFLAIVVSAGLVLSPLPGIWLVSCVALQLWVLVGMSLRRGSSTARYGAGRMPVTGLAPAAYAFPDWWKVGHGGDGLFAQLSGSHAQGAARALEAASAHLTLNTWLRALDLLKYGALLWLLLNARKSEEVVALMAMLAFAGMSNLALVRIGNGLNLLPLKGALHRLADPIERERDVAVDQSLPGDGRLALVAAGWRPAAMFNLVVSGINATVGSGQMLAITGSPGAGATTLARLCAGLLLPSEGAVLLGGVPVGACPAGAAMLVDHHGPLRAGSLRDNLTLGDATLSDALLLEALAAVDLRDSLLPRGGLDLMLDETGRALSGGQLRRLDLARALCRAPLVLVIDGALDAVEAALAAVIIGRIRGRGITLVVTSNRQETLHLADHTIRLGERLP